MIPVNRCSRCNAELDSLTPEEHAAAKADFEKVFGRGWLPGEMVSICEVCYHFMNRVRPYKAWAKAVAAGERN